MNRRESLLAILSLALPVATGLGAVADLPPMSPKRKFATINVVAFSGISDVSPGYALQSPHGLIHNGQADLDGVKRYPRPVDLYHASLETVHILDPRPFHSEVLKLGIKKWTPNV